MISVIIPVFNAELHLKRCIQSLLAQTLSSCEFIFINDGSSDTSMAIIEDFQKVDARIIVIHQENQGVSAARNAGLKIAKGNYIGFVDADDTVEPNMFETLFEMAQQHNADIVVSRYILHQNGKQTISSAFFRGSQSLGPEYIKSQVIPYMIQSDNLNAIWTKIFKRDLIQNNQIAFPVGIALGEDGLFNMKAFFHAEIIYHIDFAGYNYYEMEGSATRNFTSKNYFEAILQEYDRDFSAYENADLDAEKIARLKTEKFLNKSISLIHEYTNPNNKLSFKTTYSRISEIVNNTFFSTIIKENYNEMIARKGRYEKFILWSAKNKWIYLLFIATAYSRFRNK